MEQTGFNIQLHESKQTMPRGNVEESSELRSPRKQTAAVELLLSRTEPRLLSKMSAGTGLPKCAWES